MRWNVLFPNEGFTVEVTMKVVNELPEIVGLSIEALREEVALDQIFGTESPTIITAELLRRIPLSRLKAACLTDLAGHSEPSFLDTLREPPKRGQAPIPIHKLREVAAVYEEAVKKLENPTGRIVDELGLKPATARKYVARARKLGLLGYPDRPGVAGASSGESPITGRTTPQTKGQQQ